jgi:aspartate/tyrosine/aromatic aminotransferase
VTEKLTFRKYPLYTATLSILNARCVPYYLDEEHAWGTDMSVIKESYDKAVAEGTDVRALVVINPGNPTGASLSEENIADILTFAAEKNLVVMADEVYQTNVFIGKFHSFKRVLRQLQQKEPGKYDTVELASLNSVSKGMVGECGHRAGYFELVGFDPEVQAQIFKFIVSDLRREGTIADKYAEHTTVSQCDWPVSSRNDGQSTSAWRRELRAVRQRVQRHPERSEGTCHCAVSGLQGDGGSATRRTTGKHHLLLIGRPRSCC